VAAAVSKQQLIDGVYRGLASTHFTWQPRWSSSTRATSSVHCRLSHVITHITWIWKIRYVTARVLWAGVVSLIITTITFFLVSAAPNPAVQEAATQAALQGGDPARGRRASARTPRARSALYVRYMDFIEGVYTLDWGWSRSRSQPVTQALGEGLYYTAQYSVPWTILTVLIGPVVGVYSAANMYSWKDHAATGFAFFGYAIPNFFFGIIPF